MAISATERLYNITHRMRAQVATIAASLPGTPTVYLAEFERAPGVDTKRIGVQVAAQPWTELGNHLLTGHALDGRALLTCDLFWVRAASGEDPLQIEKAAEELAYGLDNLSLTHLDYSATFASPTTTAGARVQTLGRPEMITLPPENDLLRRQVQAVIRWIVSTDQ